MSQPLRTLVAQLVTRTHETVSECEQRYRVQSDVTAYWLMIDLRSSASFRILAGDERAYVRTEVFNHLVQMLAEAYPDLEPLKEMGDAVLLRAVSPRTVVEVLSMVDAVSRMWLVDEGDTFPSLDVRSAVTFGLAAQLAREEFSDYLGRPLDLLARISGVDPSSDDQIAVLDERSATELMGTIAAIYPFLSVSPSAPLPQELLKLGEPAQRVAHLTIDRAMFRDFRDYYAPLRTWMGYPLSL
jgi:hypothetical protein